MDTLMSLGLLTLLLFLLVPTHVLLRGRGANASRWGYVRGEDAVLGGGAYRENVLPTWRTVSAPAIVHATSFTCFFLGQMVVP